jgi:hypothetical protein
MLVYSSGVAKMTEGFGLEFAIEVAQKAAEIQQCVTAVVLLPKFGWLPCVNPSVIPTITTAVDGFFVTTDGPIRDDLPL